MSKDLVVEEVKDLSVFAIEAGQEEHLSQGELEIPFLKLAQSMTPQIKKSKPEYIEGLEEGQLFSPLSETVFGEEVKVQCHGYFHSYIMWEGAKGQGTYKGSMSVDEFREFEKTTQLTRDGGDMVSADLRYTETHSFIVTLPDFPEEGILIYPLSSTGCKVARKWNSLHTNHRLPGGKPAARYATLWNLKVGNFTNTGGFDYKQVSSIKALGWVDEELAALGKSLVDFVKDIKENGVKFDDESSVESAEESDF